MCLKIAYVTREALSSNAEGHSTASNSIIEAASRIGIDPYVITVETDSRTEMYPENYIVLDSTVNKRVYSSFLSSILFAANDLLLSPKIVANLKKLSDCKIIHVLNLNKEAYVVAHTLARVKKPVCLHFFHSPFVLSDDIFRLRKITFKLGLYSRLLSNHTITINFSTYEFLVEELGLDEERVHYVPLPIDIKRFKPRKREEIRAKYDLPIDRPIVAYVGSLDPSRGIFDLVECFSQVSNSFPYSILFISYLRRKGEEQYEEYLHKMVETLRLKNQVIIRGPSPNVEEIYNLANIVALPFARPYWVDPPLVLLEAMSSGAVVVSTSAGAIGEVMQDHVNGLLVTPKEPFRLADAIIELLSNPHESCRIARNARKTIVQKFCYKEVGSKLTKIYSRVQEIG